MKLLATAVFAGFMALSTTACAKEEPKKEAAVAAAPAAAPEAAAPATPKPEYKTVCLDVQGKDGKPVLGKLSEHKIARHFLARGTVSMI
jgi:hypothetical protein